MIQKFSQVYTLKNIMFYLVIKRERHYKDFIVMTDDESCK